MAPDPTLAACTDDKGRVLVVDCISRTVIHTIKGYRDAQVGWLMAALCAESWRCNSSVARSECPSQAGDNGYDAFRKEARLAKVVVVLVDAASVQSPCVPELHGRVHPLRHPTSDSWRQVGQLLLQANVKLPGHLCSQARDSRTMEP
jgi:hypothetical protein